MTVLLNSFEGGTSGTTITTGNSGGASGNACDATTIGSGATLAFDNTHAAHGTLAMKVATVASAASHFDWTTSMGTQTTVWFRTYLYVTANPAAGIRFFRTLTGSTLCGAVALATTGHLQAINSGGTSSGTTTNAISLNQWIRVEGFITNSATVGQVGISLFNSPDSTTATETLTTAANLNTNAQANAYQFGTATVTNGGPFWMDDIGLSSTGYLNPDFQFAATVSATAALARQIQKPLGTVPVTPVGTPAAVAIQSGNNTGSVTGSWGTGQNRTAGNFLVAVVTAYGTTSAGAIAEQSGTWTQQFQVVSAGGSGRDRVAVFTLVAAGSDTAPAFTATMTGTAGSARMSAYLYELTGQDTVTPVPSQLVATATASSSPLSVTTAGTVPAGAYAISGYNVALTAAATLTWTQGSGWADQYDTGSVSARSHSASDVYSAPPSGVPLTEAPSSSGGTVTDFTGGMIVIQPPVPVTVTASGALTRQAEPVYAGSVTTAGALSRQAARSLAAAVTTSAALLRSPGKSLAAAVTTAGALVRQPGKLAATSVTTTGTLSRALARTLAATVTTSGSITRSLARAYAATVATSAALTRTAQRVLAATVTTAGSLARACSRAFTVTVTTAATLARTRPLVFAVTVTTAGALTRTAGKLLAGLVATAGRISFLIPRRPGQPLVTVTPVNQAAVTITPAVTARIVVAPVQPASVQVTVPGGQGGLLDSWPPVLIPAPSQVTLYPPDPVTFRGGST